MGGKEKTRRDHIGQNGQLCLSRKVGEDVERKENVGGWSMWDLGWGIFGALTCNVSRGATGPSAALLGLDLSREMTPATPPP